MTQKSEFKVGDKVRRINFPCRESIPHLEIGDEAIISIISPGGWFSLEGYGAYVFCLIYFELVNETKEEPPMLKFEVGKSYRSKTGATRECLFITETQALLKCKDRTPEEFLLFHTYRNDFVELPPPPKSLGWMNVYKSASFFAFGIHPSREAADEHDEKNPKVAPRVACVEIFEGQGL